MPHVQTIPPFLPFVDALAAGLLRAARADAFVLHEALILLPTRRACRSLREAFLRQSDATALLLPRIQPIGEVEADDLLLDGILEATLPPVIGPLRRQLLLARLLAPVEDRIDHALRLASELADLLDELQTEGVALAAIDRVVPERLSAYWQKTRTILQVLAERWPEVMAEEGALEPADRRHRLLTALAERWQATPPDGRIVAAGSTGSIPATRALLQVIAGLPDGSVVLPGLDLGMDHESWSALEPGHPQHGLKQLLDALGCRREEVGLWPSGGIGGPKSAREALLGEMMRPAATIGRWQHLGPPAAEALSGLRVEEHPDLASEALALAVRMRAALEQPGRTAALITPDRQLARRVASELRRWRIEVDDSAGTSLDQTPPGAFLLLTARLIVEGVLPVSLLAVLKHPLARLGRDPATFRREVRELERTCLRGPRLAGGFAGMLNEINRALRRADDGRREQLLRLRSLVDLLASKARAFIEISAMAEADLAGLVQAHVRVAEAVALDESGRPGQLWARETGEAAAQMIAELLEATRDGHRIAPAAYPPLLALLMRQRQVRVQGGRHPRLFIWGQLEARLQHADLILIGGLNEGVWPAATDPGPWLNRTMRAALGLPPPERRVGLAAHDLVQAAAAPEAMLSRAEKDASGSPTVPSRWLVRLQTVLEAAGGTPSGLDADGCWSVWRRLLDDGGLPRPEAQPCPAPAIAARPRALSVSDVGTWMRSPYELYAKRILRLRALDPLEADPGALERGTIIHRVLERFVRAHPGVLPEDAEAQLLALGRQAFEEFAHRPQVMALWWPRFERVARWVVEQEQARRGRIARLMVEVEGELRLDAPVGPFLIRARADRIEHHPDGRVTVIDYKTGQLPKRGDVLSGAAPQLPLEAAMVEDGCFQGLEPAEVSELCFWRLKGDESGGEDGRAAGSDVPADLARAARAGLLALIAHYDQEQVGYPARARPRVAWRSEYDHLARIGEWAG